MPAIHAPRGLRRAAQAAVTVAVAMALLAYIPGPATAAGPATVAGTTATGPTDVQAAKARLLAAVEPCSTRVPRNDPVALGQCASELAVPNAEENHGVVHLIYTFLYCL